MYSLDICAELLRDACAIGIGFKSEIILNY